MTSEIIDRVPLAVLRRSVLGFLIGTGLGSGLVALAFTLDIGSIATLTAGSGGMSLRDLGLLPVTFGLLGLVVGPSIGGDADDRIA